MMRHGSRLPGLFSGDFQSVQTIARTIVSACAPSRCVKRLSTSRQALKVADAFRIHYRHLATHIATKLRSTLMRSSNARRIRLAARNYTLMT
ncbi:hypothetical protein KCP69_24570 [Salmonella enterica subsp. enterica]|nr:hypothetical protein KCP69_24570 [Salmonella enterica subsp. enterica]